MVNLLEWTIDLFRSLALHKRRSLVLLLVATGSLPSQLVPAAAGESCRQVAKHVRVHRPSLADAVKLSQSHQTNLTRLSESYLADGRKLPDTFYLLDLPDIGLGVSDEQPVTILIEDPACPVRCQGTAIINIGPKSDFIDIWHGARVPVLDDYTSELVVQGVDGTPTVSLQSLGAVIFHSREGRLISISAPRMVEEGKVSVAALRAPTSQYRIEIIIPGADLRYSRLGLQELTIRECAK